MEGRPVVVTSAQRLSGHWLIGYNTRDFAESGNDLDELLGNAPLRVLDDGTIEGNEG